VKRLPLTKGKEAVVDDTDYRFANRWKWTLHTKGYAYRRVRQDDKQTVVWLHRVIAERAGIGIGIKGRYIDHSDRNPLNCRRSNLRAATNSQNLANRGKNRNNTSGRKGVTWDKSRHKWMAQIMVQGRVFYLGRHSKRDAAYAAYLAASYEHFGEYAYAE